MWIWRLNKPNPHAQRLQRHYAKPIAGESYQPGWRVGLLLGALGHGCLVQGIAMNLYDVPAYFLYTALGLGGMALGWGVYAAWFTAHDTAQPLFDLILLTHLTPLAIISGYFVA